MSKNKVTKKDHEIVDLLLKFRFLNTFHFQRILNHKNPTRIQVRLKKLLDNGYVKRIYEPKNFAQKAQPAIYYLAPKARTIVKDTVDISQLEYIYKEHTRKEKFIMHCLFLADIYLFFYVRQENNEEVKFFTKLELSAYRHFPDPLPDAFVAFKGQTNTRRFFLDFFDESTPAWVMRKRVRKYLDYAENSDWDEKTNYLPLPKLLFICPSETIKRHIYKYSEALLEKTYEDKIQLFLTTKTMIQFADKIDNIWTKVEV